MFDHSLSVSLSSRTSQHIEQKKSKNIYKYETPKLRRVLNVGVYSLAVQDQRPLAPLIANQY